MEKNKKKQMILVVDDEKNMRTLLCALFSDEGYDTDEAANGVEAIEKVKKRFYDLILLDMKMPKMDGVTALKEIKKISHGIPIVMMTAYATVLTAVESMKLGAYDYITKPFNTDELKTTARDILEYQKFLAEKREDRGDAVDHYHFEGIIGISSTIKDIINILSLVSPTNATILIQGESGTGKELIARAVHRNSLRAEKVLIIVNCAALPEGLVETELFGHEKGAFTSAVAKKEGKFELAHGGTIFLDEIGDLNLTTQAKLLRAIQEKEFERVGGTKTIKVDVRIIAATNKDLVAEVEAKRFREDLFYRLNVVAIQLPALRERKEDIPLLAAFFIKKYNQENSRNVEGLSPLSLDIMTRYNWPGNIRELENVIERAVIVCKQPFIQPEHLPAPIQAASIESIRQLSKGPELKLKVMEKQAIQETLDELKGNKSKTAQKLGISRKSLYNKIKKYDLLGRPEK
jgi:two-component system response regulator HydG